MAQTHDDLGLFPRTHIRMWVKRCMLRKEDARVFLGSKLIMEPQASERIFLQIKLVDF